MNRKMVASVVILLLLLSAAALTGCTDDDNEQDTPEGTFELFMQRVKEEDGEGVFQLTDLYLIDNEEVQEFKDGIITSINEGNWTWSEYNIEDVRYKEDMDEEEREMFDEMKDTYNDTFKLDLEDHCMIDFTVVEDGDEESTSFPMVKIRDKWYIGIAYMALPESDEDIAAMSGRRERVGDNWIISIDGGNVPFNDGEDFRLYDTETGQSIAPDGDVGESEATAGTFTVEISGVDVEFAVWFNDNDNNGQVNSGDTIVIVDPFSELSFEFRITGTNFRITLSDKDTTAMSGRRERVGDNIIISIDGGNVPFNNGLNFRLYNRTSGASIGPDGVVGETEDANTTFTADGNTYYVWFNDNDDNDRVNGGDTIVIVDAGNDLRDDFQFRISDTNLAVNL